MIKSWLKALSPFIWTENPPEGGRERENERARDKKNKKGKIEIVTLRERESFKCTN